MNEQERFERWEQKLNDSVKFTEREALQARTRIAHLDRTGKTKYPTTPQEES